MRVRAVESALLDAVAMAAVATGALIWPSAGLIVGGALILLARSFERGSDPAARKQRVELGPVTFGAYAGAIRGAT